MGTYDNSITNTAILSLMMEDSLPDQVVVAFTGDEERESRGATEVTKYLHKKDKKFKTVVLDVTDFGWSDGADFTIENNFWKDKMGMKVCNTANEIGYPWLFVPKDLGRIPEYIHERRIFPESAEPDESWKYMKLNIRCFSLCLPVQGSMHTNQGVIARSRSFYRYVEALRHICASLIDVPIAG